MSTPPSPTLIAPSHCRPPRWTPPSSDAPSPPRRQRIMHPTHQSQGQGYTHSDSDGSFKNDDGAPRPRRGISGQGGVSDRCAGAYRRRRLDDGSGSRRPRRRHRSATSHRAEDLKTYDPKDIGECLACCCRVHSMVVLGKGCLHVAGTSGVLYECGPV